MNVDFFGIWLEGDKETLQARAQARTCDASDADAGVVEQQFTYDLGIIDWHKIDATQPFKRVEAEARKILSKAAWRVTRF